MAYNVKTKRLLNLFNLNLLRLTPSSSLRIAISSYRMTIVGLLQWIYLGYYIIGQKFMAKIVPLMFKKKKKWPALLLFCQLGGWSVSTSNTSYALECSTVCTTCTSASVLYSIKTLKDRNKSLFEWMNRWKNQRGRLFMYLEIYYHLNWYNTLPCIGVGMANLNKL